MHWKFIILITLTWNYTALGQAFIRGIEPHTGQTITLNDLQRSFYQWSRKNDLDHLKGWKSYKRWEEFNAERAFNDGTLPDPSVFAREAIKIAGEKRGLSKARTKMSGWSPLGPSEYPVTNDPLMEVGLGRINTITFHPTDPNTMWAGVAQGGVWKTTDHGESWTPLTEDLPILRISDIAVSPSNTDIMYISVGDFAYIGWSLTTNDRKRHTHYGLGVYKTIDGGATWQPTGLSFAQTDFDGSLVRRVMIDPEDPDHLVAATTTGIWKSRNGGANWEIIYEELMWDIEKDPSDHRILYASSGFVNLLQRGTVGIIKSTDFGDTWEELEIDIPPVDAAQRLELTISPVDPDYLYAAACNLQGGLFGIYRSTNGGESWELQATEPNLLDSDQGLSGNFGGGTYDLALLADPVDRDKLFIGGIIMWGSEDGGINWNGISHWLNDFGSSLHADLHFFAFNPLTDRYYVCSDGGLYSTSEVKMGSWDDAINVEGYQWPTEWRKMSGGINATSFYSLGLSDNNPGYVVAGAQDNSSFFYDNTEWRSFVIGDGMKSLIHPDNPDDLLVSIQRGRLSRSIDGGQTFVEDITKEITDNEFGAWTVPLVRDAKDPLVIYGAWGNLWKSVNGGDHWSKVSEFARLRDLNVPLPTSALAVSRINSDFMFLAKRPFFSQGALTEIWRTTDGGFSWKSVTGEFPVNLYITDIEMDDNDLRKVWLTTSGFNEGQKVFYSDNSGQSWQNISANLPNIPVNAIAQVRGAAKNDLYIATDLGVYYRNDDMEDWELYSLNLPNVIVSDLEVHLATKKLYAATFGRGVWVTDLVNFENDFSVVTAVDDNFVENIAMDIYPNPSAKSINLTIKGLDATRAKLDIIDINGRIVFSENIQLTSDQFRKELTPDIRAGLYFLKITSGHHSRSHRFIMN